jgi:flagellar FliJ protein
MADLKGLIRLRRHELDEKRRVLGELNAQVEALHDRRQTILQKLEKEKNLAAVDINAAQGFGQYLNGALNTCKDIDKEIEKLMVHVEKATEIVRQAFMEVKKIELTQENRDKEAEAVIAKRETAELDEAGLNSHRRRSE